MILARQARPSPLSWPLALAPASPCLSLALALTLALTVALALPYTAFGAHLGFVPPPAVFFLVLTGILVAYLLAVEGVKQLFYRHLATT